MKLFAVIMVLIAGTMWAGTGLAAQDFFRKSSLDAMDLTVFRMFSAGIIMFLVSLMKGQWKAGVRAVQRKPLLFLELVFYGIVGLMLMHYTYFASIAAGNAAAATVIQYTCPAMVILWVSLKNRKLPARGELLAVVLAIAGVFLLVTGGDIHRISVPAACVYLALASALFFAVCAVYPKHLMTVMDNSFILAIGMFTGAISAWLIDPVTDFSGFFQRSVLFDSFWIVICGTVVAFTCYNAGLHYLSEAQASVTATVEPAVSVIASLFLFDVRFDSLQALGILLVILAIAAPGLVGKQGSRQEK